MKNISIYSFLLFVSLLLFSCADTAKDFKYMGKLSEQLQKKYPDQKIELLVTNSTILSVSFVNTSYNDSSDLVKERIACEISKLVNSPTEGRPNFDSGEVIFINKKDYFIAKSSTSQKYAMCFQNCPECDEIK